jgi:hypothetical protein
VSAVAAGCMLLLWRLMLEEGRRRVWRLYGRFCALMLCGSCFGAVAWTARMTSLENLFQGNDAATRSELAAQYSFLALSYSWAAVFFVTYAIEFMCLSAAKLMVLDRMSEFAAGQGDGTRRRWTVGGRVVMAVVVLGNGVGVAAEVAAAVQFQRAAKVASTVSAYFADGRSQDAREYVSLLLTEVQLATSISAVQSFSEVAVLLLIVAAFIVAGLFCGRLLSSGLRAAGTGSTSEAAGGVLRHYRRQVVGTTAFVFVAFVVRSTQSTMAAVCRQLQDAASICPGVSSICDASCTNVYTHMTYWLLFTPEFQVTVVLISSPVALLVSLWGVTSRFTLQLFTSRKQHSNKKRVNHPLV